MTIDELNSILAPHKLRAVVSGHINTTDLYRIDPLPVPTRGEQVAEKMVREVDGEVQFVHPLTGQFCKIKGVSDWMRKYIAAAIDAERQQARDTAFEEAAKIDERYWEIEKRHGTTEQKRADDAANYAMSIRMGIGTREETKP